MEQEKKILFTEEAVDVALKLVALGAGRILDRETADKELKKLPESLQNKVMIVTIAAIKTQEKVREDMASYILKKIIEND